MPHNIVGVAPNADPVPLLPAESVIFSVHPSVVPLVALLIIVLAAGIALSAILLTTNIPNILGIAPFAGLIIFAPVVVALLLDIIILLSWLNTVYTLTNIRVEFEAGIIGKRRRSIDNSDIQAVESDQGIIGRLFNFGDIHVRSAQQPIPIDFTQIADPTARAEQIEAEEQ